LFRKGSALPKYQYRCNDCGADLEIQQKFTDDTLTVCPECQGDLRKVFSAVGVVFKGSGFYKTDNRPKVSESSGSGDSGSTSDSGSGSGSASEKSTAPAKTDTTSAA